MADVGEHGWDLVITPKRGWFDVDLKGVWSYRDLVMLLVRRDFVAFYKQTVLGPAWFVVQPLVTTLVFTIIFGRIAGIPTDGVPPFLFYMAAVVPWTYFAQSLTKTSDVFVANAGIFGKVYFPRLVVPLATVITNLATFGIQFGLFLAFYLFYHWRGAGFNWNAWMALLPFFVLHMALLALSVGILISAMTAKYRDLALIVGFGVQLWMYATPIVYPLSQVPEAWRPVFALNPVTGIVESFRHAFFGTPAPGIAVLATGVMVTGVLLIFGLLLFSRVERWAADTV
jgi:lipopolysaccharide transport system permease protein